MSRELAVDKKLGIEQLYASGMPKRRIARTFGIDRNSVDRHVARLGSKGPSLAEAPTGKALTGPADSKGSKRPTGSESVKPAPEAAAVPVKVAFRSCSECMGFYKQITALALVVAFAGNDR